MSSCISFLYPDSISVCTALIFKYLSLLSTYPFLVSTDDHFTYIIVYVYWSALNCLHNFLMNESFTNMAFIIEVSPGKLYHWLNQNVWDTRFKQQIIHIDILSHWKIVSSTIDLYEERNSRPSMIYCRNQDTNHGSDSNYGIYLRSTLQMHWTWCW